MWAFVLPLWAYVLVGFCPRGFCPRGFCPRGFCPTLQSTDGYYDLPSNYAIIRHCWDIDTNGPAKMVLPFYVKRSREKGSNLRCTDKRPPDKKQPDKRPLKMPTPDKRPHGQKTTRTKGHHRRNFVVYFDEVYNELCASKKMEKKFQ